MEIGDKLGPLEKVEKGTPEAVNNTKTRITVDVIERSLLLYITPHRRKYTGLRTTNFRSNSRYHER